MKNPFRKKKGGDPAAEEKQIEQEKVEAPPAEGKEPDPLPAPAEKEPEDDFTEWCRSQVHGGIERRERNDIYEAYNVYGALSNGQLVCRRWHRYPEHEKDFGLSYSRELTFDEFNRRLLAELDRGDLKLSDYREVIRRAEALSGEPEQDEELFSDSEQEAICLFCEGMDHLKDHSFLHQNGVLCCECESIAGGERLNIRFRKPLRHDALNAAIAGVKKESISGYDIENMWILGVYNRLYEKGASCRVTVLTSEWSLQKESVYLIEAKGFPVISGSLLIAVGESENFRRFGFYSLDFSN